jgi:hypothetical protein
VFGAFEQAPAPLHTPVFPQGTPEFAAHRPSGSGEPEPTFAQRPCCPEMLHDLHRPQLETSQHTPLVQCPLLHSWSEEHEAPSAFLPQTPSRQVFGATQSLATAHVRRHAFPSHVNGAQERRAPAVQWPLPSQVDAAM